MALPEMAMGGVWLLRSPDVPHAYVVGEDVIARHLRDGWVIVDDPREDPDTSAVVEVPAETQPPSRRKSKK